MESRRTELVRPRVGGRTRHVVAALRIVAGCAFVLTPPDARVLTARPARALGA